MAKPHSGIGAPLDLEAVERELRARDTALRERLAALARPPERGAELGFGKRIGDGTTEAVSRLNDVAVGSSLEASEARITRALAKLAEGSYGLCDALWQRDRGGAAAGGARERALHRVRAACSLSHRGGHGSRRRRGCGRLAEGRRAPVGRRRGRSCAMLSVDPRLATDLGRLNELQEALHVR